MKTQVLIVGAGPTGLVLALWLNAQGVPVRIIDKSTEPGTTSRAMAVQARTLELYQQLGIGDAVAAAGHKVGGVNMWVGDKKRAHLDVTGIGGQMTPYPFLLIYPQDLHERFLVERLKERGIEVERQTELVSFEQQEHRVTSQLRRANGETETCNASYLAGCDGARSAVRTQLGASFEGGTYDQMFYVADILTTSEIANGEAHIAFDGPDFVLILPYGQPGKVRLIGTVRADRVGSGETFTLDDINRAPLDAVGLRVEAVNWFSTYRVHHRVTSHFRHGRAFLLGDAAHIHSPAGGQGMNTGIGDAINLAWKLATVLKGAARDSLLDTIDSERQVFAHKLVETTDRAFTAVTQQGSVAEFMRTSVAPVLAKLVYGFEPTRELFFHLISQLGLSYPESPLSAGRAGKVDGGERLPFVRFDGGDNYVSLSAITWQIHVYGTASAELKQWCEEHSVPLHEFPWHEEFAKSGLSRDAVYLLRPDSYVGLAEPQGDVQAVDTYFSERGIQLNNASLSGSLQ